MLNFPKVWSSDRTGIYQFIRERVGVRQVDGSLPDNEEFYKGRRLRWVAGGLDGALVDTDGVRGVAQAKAILAAVREVIREPSKGNVGRLYALVIEGRVIDLIDPFLSLLAEGRIAAAPELRVLAHWLAMDAPDREAVKFGIALLGRCGDSRDADILRILGRHDEFTLYASVALCETLADPEPVLWELAKCVHGWGRIHLVRRLGSTTNESIKRWMLREGYKNSIMQEYLAYRCATTGGLLAALHDPQPDEALLAGAGEIIEALLTGGPAEDMDDYVDGPEAVRLYLDHVARRPTPDIRHFSVIEAIKSYVEDRTTDWNDAAKRGWSEHLRRDFARNAAAILARGEWREVALQGLLSDDDSTFRNAASILERLGIDAWEVHFERQRLGKSEAVSWLMGWHWLMKTDDPQRVDRVIMLAEEQLDLRAIGSGPKDEIGLGGGQQLVLAFLLANLCRFPGKGGKLVVTALKSPVVRNRISALRVLESWPRTVWPQDARTVLENGIIEEPDADVRQGIRNLLDGFPLDAPKGPRILH